MKPAKCYSSSEFRREFLNDQARVLNAGSGTSRKRARDINVDIVMKPGVDFVHDLHDLPLDWTRRFNAVICVAVLQYCWRPWIVLSELQRVLEPGGYLYLDAPFVQPECPDTPDRWRFTRHCLIDLASDAELEVIRCEPSIPPGAALAMLASDIAGSMSKGNRWVNGGLRLGADVGTLPLKRIQTAEPSKTAGAHYLVARKAS